MNYNKIVFNDGWVKGFSYNKESLYDNRNINILGDIKFPYFKMTSPRFGYEERCSPLLMRKKTISYYIV